MSDDPFAPMVDRSTARPAAAPPKPAFNPRAQHARFALGRLKPGQMNKSEQAYSVHLEAEKYAGNLLWWKFEGIKLRLADNTFLTVDFAVMTADGELQMHEVKGWMEGDAAVKLKVAADMYPLRFFVVRAKLKRDGGGFSVKDVSGGL